MYFLKHILHIRASKGRQSMVQTTQEMADALKLAKPFNIKSNGDGHLPTFDESHAENDDDNKEEAADQLSKLTVIPFHLFLIFKSIDV